MAPQPATRREREREREKGESELLHTGVGQEGRKKSDKTMERNLNYAPRKMAIVCKAMLIQRSRK